MTIVWHYILHNSSDAPLSFQWVSRNRALYEGKHALAYRRRRVVHFGVTEHPIQEWTM